MSIRVLTRKGRADPLSFLPDSAGHGRKRKKSVPPPVPACREDAPQGRGRAHSRRRGRTRGGGSTGGRAFSAFFQEPRGEGERAHWVRSLGKTSWKASLSLLCEICFSSILLRLFCEYKDIFIKLLTLPSFVLRIVQSPSSIPLCRSPAWLLNAFLLSLPVGMRLFSVHFSSVTVFFPVFLAFFLSFSAQISAKTGPGSAVVQVWRPELRTGREQGGRPVFRSSCFRFFVKPCGLSCSALAFSSLTSAFAVDLPACPAAWRVPSVKERTHACDTLRMAFFLAL